MLTQGIKDGVIIFGLTISVGAAMLFSGVERDIISASVLLTFFTTYLLTGYRYRKKHGSLFSTAMHQKQKANLWHYILGVGLIWAPVCLFIGGYPISDTSIIVNLVLPLVAVPIAGMNIIGAILVGGMFYKEKTEYL